MKKILLLLFTIATATVTDIDGNVYETVLIGGQLWIAENLKVTHYNNGDAIPTGLDNWGSTEEGAYAIYDDVPVNADIYGNLYNWYSVDDSRGVCPVGWHVPTDNEFTVLTDLLGEEAGGKMKETGLEHWFTPNTGATNESGFTALPAGYRRYNGSYNVLGDGGDFWSYTEHNSDRAWYLELKYNFSYVYRDHDNKKYGFSIRCLADEVTTGCTDPEAINYNADGSCTYPDNGNYSLYFDGNSDKVRIPYNSDLSIGNQINIERTIFIKFNAEGPGHLIYKQDRENPAGSNYNDYTFFVTNSDEYIWGSGNSNDDCAWSVSTIPVEYTNWNFVQLDLKSNSNNTGTKNIYINGLNTNSCEYENKGYSTNDSLLIGSDFHNDYDFQGYIDEIIILNNVFDESMLFSNDDLVNNENLIAHYRFNAGLGDILYDHSGNANHGTIYGATWVENYPTNINYDYSMEFNNDNYAIISNNDIGTLSSNTDFTIETWAKFKNDDIGEFRGLFEKGYLHNGGYVLRKDDTERISFDLNTINGYQYIIQGSTNIIQDKWYHIALTNDNGNLVLYLNGDIESDSTLNGINLGSNYPLRLGIGNENATDSEILDGKMYLPRLWDIALTHQEIQELIDCQDNNLNILPQAHWGYDEDNTEILSDYTFNHNGSFISNIEWSNDIPDEPYCFSHDLGFGNNLISYPGYLDNDSSQDLLDGLMVEGADVVFLLGQGVGLFNTENGWSGNLNNITPTSGYWLNVLGSHVWDIEFTSGLEACTSYEISSGNNLMSYKWGQGSSSTMYALGGEAFATDNFNFILGQGVGLFNTEPDTIIDNEYCCDLDCNTISPYSDRGCGWSGNLNTLVEGKGYWVNVVSPSAGGQGASLDFRWGFDNCSSESIQSNPTVELDKQLPEELQFVQSTGQAFYLMKDIVVDSNQPKEDDIVLAYNNDILVGSALWGGKYTAVPVMGKDISGLTDGFCDVGDKVDFKLYQAETGNIVDLNGSTDSWNNLLVTHVEKLSGSTNIELPSVLTLNPAYPNPFNPVTTISYGLPLETHITLNIYDVEGRRITTLTEGIRTAGTHSIEWNAEGYPSGVYFVKLDAGEFTQTQKLMLVK